MVWAILALIGVPLWLCAAGIFILLHNNRTLRKRPGNIPVRVLLPGKSRWKRGHALWVSDVFAWRSSPAGWSEDLCQVEHATIRDASAEEQKQLHGIGDDPVVARLEIVGREPITVAASAADRAALIGSVGDRDPAEAPEAAVTR